MSTYRRRWQDRAPITGNITWRIWLALNRMGHIHSADAVCFCAIGVIYGGGMWVVAQWVLGA